MAEDVLAQLGAVDIVINNAGVVNGRMFLDAEDEHLERTMKVNIMAHMWMLKAYLPAMLARNSGYIVTVASTMGYAPAVGLSDYCASKHAAVGFHESIRLELRRLNSAVRTLLVCPYATSTGMFEGIQVSAGGRYNVLHCHGFVCSWPDQLSVVVAALERTRRR